LKELIHRPVLLNEVLQLIVTRKDGIHLDCTVGLGGHAEAILNELSPQGRLVGIDRDQQALDAARERLKGYRNCTLLKLNFSQLEQLPAIAGAGKFTGMLFDLGLGSWQISQKERGFSYLAEGPLDMRMDRSQKLTALEVVNNYSFTELTKIFKELGEERLGKRIAARIKSTKSKIENTRQLAEIVERAVPFQSRIKSLARIFQALRMEVNQELEELRIGLNLALQALEPKGRLGLISYHSLEDALVKKTFQELTKSCHCPPQSPICICGAKVSWKKITRKVIRPSPAEVQANPSSRSAKLRVIERLEG